MQDVSISSPFGFTATLLAAGSPFACAGDATDVAAGSPTEGTSEDSLIACNARGAKLAFTIDAECPCGRSDGAGRAASWPDTSAAFTPMVGMRRAVEPLNNPVIPVAASRGVATTFFTHVDSNGRTQAVEGAKNNVIRHAWMRAHDVRCATRSLPSLSLIHISEPTRPY